MNFCDNIRFVKDDFDIPDNLNVFNNDVSPYGTRPLVA